MWDTTRVLLLLSLSSALLAQNDRDFSGRWYFKPEKSELQSLPEPPEAIVVIEQSGGLIHEFRGGVGGETHGAALHGEEIATFRTDGHDTKRERGDLTFSSQTKWEGSALLINTIVSAPSSSYTIADRWRLSRDGSRLTISRHIVRSQGETESTLVYENAAKPLPRPALITAKTPAPAPEPAIAAPRASLRMPETTPETVPEPSDGVAPAAGSPAMPDPAPAQPDYIVAQGTKLPLRLINSVDTKHSAAGDRVYLETVYPVLSHGHVVIPPGSYVMGSLSQVQQAGRVKGKSSFFLRFDSLTLPNGTTRDFRSHMSGMDGDGKGSLNRKEGTVVGESGKGADARTIGTTTAIGTGVGAAIGSAAGHLGSGLGIGAAAGALGGLAAVLATRGPDAILQRGTTVEMVLDRDLTFSREEVGQR